MDAYRAFVIGVFQHLGPLYFPLPPRRPHKDWLHPASLQIMSLLFSWRTLRVQERSWGRLVRLRLIFHGWQCYLVVDAFRGSLNNEIATFCRLMDYRLAYLDYLVDWLVARKCSMVRADRRNRTVAIVGRTAQAAGSGVIQ